MRKTFMVLALALALCVGGCSGEAIWNGIKAPFAWISGGGPAPQTVKQQLVYIEAAVTSSITSVNRSAVAGRLTKKQATDALKVLEGTSAALDVAWELEKAGQAASAKDQIKVVEDQLRLIEIYTKAK